MNREYPCDIIKDLLPGYIDGILSGTGRNAVEEHLIECSECRLSYEGMSEEMQAELGTVIIPEEQAALDGFKKVRQFTKKLKLTVGIMAGLLVLCFMSVLLKVYVIGSLMTTGPVEITDCSYDEETGNLVLGGTLHLADYHVSRIVCKESDDEEFVVNVHVYVAETLPFLLSGQAQEDFSVTIPDAKGYVVYLAGPGYDRSEVYNWKHSHYEKLAEMEEEIYSRIPALDKEQDALSCNRGIESVNGKEGIAYTVTTMIGDDAYYWWFNDQLAMYGDFATLSLDIWISLEEPYQILVFDYGTGQYTDDFSLVEDRKKSAEPEVFEWAE
ncbi:MAG: zf-HC2 domain-containing protein [Lachnospiraceae bacterium]|nr:zf-HC2 domain-containing protein [Lachnospiraceae bacterium]